MRIHPPSLAVPGSFYPAAAVPGFKASDFSSASRLRAVQPGVFDSSGNLVLPKDLPSILTAGTVVRAEVCFGAWTSSNKTILVRFVHPFHFASKLNEFLVPICAC
jgi:hypothetical protein